MAPPHPGTVMTPALATFDPRAAGGCPRSRGVGLAERLLVGEVERCRAGQVLPSVDDDEAAGDVGGGGSCEEASGVRDVVDVAQALERNRFDERRAGRVA